MPPCSVIQGGIGSVLLYLVHTNDLPDVIHSQSVDYKEPMAYCQDDGNMINFFDDRTVSDKNPDTLSEKLNPILGVLEVLEVNF